MLTDNEKYKEQGFIGDEIFQSREKEIEHLCRIVQSTVERKVFTLDEALTAYEIKREDYDFYLANNFFREIQGTANSLSEKENALTYLNVARIFLNLRFENRNYKGLNRDFEKIDNELSRLSKKIEREKPSIYDAD
jgi:hypothetical protein